MSTEPPDGPIQDPPPMVRPARRGNTEWRPRTALDDVSRQYVAAIEDGDVGEAALLGLVLDTVSQLEHSNSQDVFAVSLTYAKRGIAVFPCEPRGKRPLTKHGFKDASTDIAQIAAWWQRWPDANIGTPTGHRFDVLDIDGPNGVKMMWGSNYPVYGCRAATLDVIAHVSTPSPGGHHLYVPPKAALNEHNAVKLWDGCDYRGLGGYVILPPSVGANGIRYTWIRELQDVPAQAHNDTQDLLGRDPLGDES
jgi:hypothetical protein